MYEEIVKRFGIPEAARDYVKDMFTEQEIYFVENMDKPEFTKEDIAEMIPSDPDFARSAYQRGILSLASDHEEVYRLNNFYGMLDVFAISRQEVYRSFPKEVQKALDDWYFQAYLDGLDPDLTAAPTEDRVLTLDETLQFIDEQERTPYLNFCDCRSLAGDCGMPTKTCITYRDGINTFVHRGHSQALTKEEAKDVVRQADKDGLMHTVNSNGIAIAAETAVTCSGDSAPAAAQVCGPRQSISCPSTKSDVSGAANAPDAVICRRLRWRTKKYGSTVSDAPAAASARRHVPCRPWR